MSITKDIVDNWDKDYGTLGGEEFNPQWLKDPVMTSRLLAFLSMMDGHIADATHHLEGDAKAARIDEIQRSMKDVIWDRARQNPMHTSDTKEFHLKHMKRLIGAISRNKR